jgi:hypothetical protein
LTTKVGTFAEIEDEFNRYVGSIVYATMVTVDANNRPRTRVLIPVWENLDGRPVGWLATFPTPVKERHLANNPHTSFSYVAPPGLSSVGIDAVATGIDDLDRKSHVWELYRKTSPRGAGYDLGRFWTSPSDPKLRILRLDPFRVQVIRGSDLRSRIWSPETVTNPTRAGSAITEPANQ